MTGQPRLLDAPSGLRNARVLHYGPGHPIAILVVAIDGIADPLPILAPPKGIPAVGAEIAVREVKSVHGATFWVFAGGPTT